VWKKKEKVFVECLDGNGLAIIPWWGMAGAITVTGNSKKRKKKPRSLKNSKAKREVHQPAGHFRLDGNSWWTGGSMKGDWT